MRKILVVLTLLLAAKTQAQYERILLPITPGTVFGAYGSQWTTAVTITNMSDSAVTVGGFKQDCGGFVCQGVPSIQPHATVITDAVYGCSAPGVFLLTEPSRMNDIGVTLRTRDMSRQNQTWGTAIPVVTAASLFDRTFQVGDVPTEVQFRALLRIYNFDSTGTGGVRVRLYSIDPGSSSTHAPDGRVGDTLISDVVPTFVAASSTGCPSYAEVPLASSGTPSTRVRAEIQPLDGRKNYWAFASITHNDTQFVTVIAPKQ